MPEHRLLQFGPLQPSAANSANSACSAKSLLAAESTFFFFSFLGGRKEGVFVLGMQLHLPNNALVLFFCWWFFIFYFFL